MTKQKQAIFVAISQSGKIFYQGIYIPAVFVYISPEQSRYLALSATGTGSCPEDEGAFHDGVTAPAVAYRKPSFM